MSGKLQLKIGFKKGEEKVNKLIENWERHVDEKWKIILKESKVSKVLVKLTIHLNSSLHKIIDEVTM